MIIECPSCSSTFNLDESMIPAEGRKVRCSVCENVFDVRPPSAAEPTPPPADDDDIELGDDFGEDDDDLLASLGEADDDDDAGAPAPGGGDDLEAEDDDLDGSGLSLDFGEAAPKKKGKKGKKGGKGGKGKLIGLIAAGVVLVLGIGVGLTWYLAPGLLGLAPAMDEAAQAEGEALPMAEQVKKISLESIKQYYVDNDKAGRMFVIQGKAVNLFDSPKELVEIEAGLYDAENNELATRRLKCGNTIDLFQLQTLGEQEIEDALANETGIGANNINIQPGGSVPFMVVFFNPPETLAEFNVKVVAARNVDL